MGNELLAAVDVEGGASERRVDHDVHRQRGDVGRPDHAADGQRGPELGAPLVKSVAEQRGGQRRVDEPGREEVDPDRRHLARPVGPQGGPR